MALKSLFPFMIFALLSVTTAFGRWVVPAPSPDVAGAPTLPPDSGLTFVSLNAKSAQVVGLGKFTIDEVNKLVNTKLVYSSVLEALAISDARGTKYDLVIVANDLNDALLSYKAVVLSEKNVRKVVFFDEIQ